MPRSPRRRRQMSSGGPPPRPTTRRTTFRKPRPSTTRVESASAAGRREPRRPGADLPQQADAGRRAAGEVQQVIIPATRARVAKTAPIPRTRSRARYGCPRADSSCSTPHACCASPRSSSSGPSGRPVPPPTCSGWPRWRGGGPRVRRLESRQALHSDEDRRRGPWSARCSRATPAACSTVGTHRPTCGRTPTSSGPSCHPASQRRPGP